MQPPLAHFLNLEARPAMAMGMRFFSDSCPPAFCGSYPYYWSLKPSCAATISGFAISSRGC